MLTLNLKRVPMTAYWQEPLHADLEHGLVPFLWPGFPPPEASSHPDISGASSSSVFPPTLYC
jgi:hypothetical protein